MTRNRLGGATLRGALTCLGTVKWNAASSHGWTNVFEADRGCQTDQILKQHQGQFPRVTDVTVTLLLHEPQNEGRLIRFSLSSRGTSGERVGEKGGRERRTTSPRPSPPFGEERERKKPAPTRFVDTIRFQNSEVFPTHEPARSPGFSRFPPPKGGTTYKPLRFMVPIRVNSLDVFATHEPTHPCTPPKRGMGCGRAFRCSPPWRGRGGFMASMRIQSLEFYAAHEMSPCQNVFLKKAAEA